MDVSKASEDFKIFEKILKDGHPSLYDYIDKEELDTAFNMARASLIEDTLDISLFKKMQKITERVKDGHLLLFPPSTLNTNQYYFPLILKIIKTDFFIDTDDFGIPIGSKILAVNGKEISHILEALKKYAVSDGYNLTRKYRDIELKFGLYYACEYGVTKEFDIKYSTPEGIEKTIVLPSESFVIVKHRNTKRNSYFAKYHSQKDGIDFFAEHINKKEPFIYYKHHLKTAVLVVNSFSGDINAFKSSLIRLFKEIRKNKIKHLVIDIRYNDGGYRPNAINLFSFVTDTIFKQRTSSFVSSLTIPEKEYSTRSYDEKQFLKDKFYNHPVYDGWKLNFDDLETMMIPNRERFTGNVYVLAGGATFSAGSSFALLAKNDPDILLVGEETGGGYYTHTGQFPVHYKLPNSKIIMVMSMEKILHYVKDTSIPKGSGVSPDRTVSLTKEDLIKGKDTQLDYIFKVIHGHTKSK
ncbi:hypothetical protein GCM10022393_23030 [Aquimarina addita]|uniref:Tail specific protease domain-containing protein n=1 Tax=Aquimarina addita TaxID=870485 RepID=A0ABP6UMG8_9FLAO